MGLRLVAAVDCGECRPGYIRCAGIDRTVRASLDEGAHRTVAARIVDQVDALVIRSDLLGAEVGMAVLHQVEQVRGKTEAHVELAGAAHGVGRADVSAPCIGQGNCLGDTGSVECPCRIARRGNRVVGVDRGAVAGAECAAGCPPILEAAGAVGTECRCCPDKIASALDVRFGVGVGSEVAGDLPDFSGGRITQPRGGHAPALGLENGKDTTVVEEIFHGSIEIDVQLLLAACRASRRCGPNLDTLEHFGEACLALGVFGEVGQRLVGERSGADVVAGAELSQVNRLTGVRLIEGRLEHGAADDRASHFLQAQ